MNWISKVMYAVLLTNITGSALAEGCENMFCNYQGIMLGNGQVWIGEVLDKNGENGKLKVIAVNSTN